MPKKKQRELLAEAKKCFIEARDYWRDNYRQGEEDYKFTFGLNQWSDDYVSDRQKNGQPCLTINMMKPYADQVINDIRQSRPAIRVSPVDDKADPETAEIFQGIIRNIERQSKANIAYDTGAMNSVTAGIGWIRIRTDYCAPMSFDQDAIIDRVLDFRSVFPDTAFKSLDGSDMEYCFLYTDIPEDQFEEQYPDADKASIDPEWRDEETIRIVEYFYKEYKSYTLYKTDSGIVTAQEAGLLTQAGVPFKILDERETLIPSIKWCKFTASEILEENDWVGKYIPIVPVIGSEVFVDGRREFHSLIRQAKDPQKMLNYWQSADAEIVALQPKAPWVGPVGSFESTPNKWKNANIKNYAFLEYDPVYDETSGMLINPNGPTRQPPIMGSAHIMQKCISARDDIRLALGMPEAVMGQRSNEISGVAVRNRQIEGDNATFHFMDNLSASITQVGVILVDLIQKLYTERQIARIIGDDGEERNVPLNVPFIETENGPQPARPGEQYKGIYDIKSGKYDVVCDVGPSYSSKRQQAADTLIQITGAKPELFDVVGDLLFKAMDIPYGQEISDRLKAMMDPAILGDDPQAAKLQQASEMVKQLQDQMLTLSAALDEKKNNQAFENQVKMGELELKKQELEIKAAETAAKIQQMQAQTQGQNQENMAPVIQGLIELATQVQDVGQALDVILSTEEVTGEPQSPAILTEQTQ